MDNEQIIRTAYQIAEDKDSEGWLAAFTPVRRPPLDDLFQGVSGPEFTPR